MTLDLPSRRANVANLRAKATTDDERWICDEFTRLFDEIEGMAARLSRADALAGALESQARFADHDYAAWLRDTARRIRGALK